MSETPEITPGTVAEAAQPAAQQRPRRRRVRWIVALLILLAGGGWFGHFAYLRITLHPEPRTAYWEARLAEIDPPPPGARPASEAYKVLTNRPFEVGSPFVGGKQLVSWSEVGEMLLYGRWEPQTRPEIQVADKIFRSLAFGDARNAVISLAKAGWVPDVSFQPPRGVEHPADGVIAWSDWLLGHSRWARMQPHEDQTAIENWLTCLHLERELMRMGVGMSATRLNSITQEIIIAAGEGVSIPDLHKIVAEVDSTFGPVPRPADLAKARYCYSKWWIERIFVRRGNGWLDVSALCSSSGMTPPSRLWNLTSPLFNDYVTTSRGVEQSVAPLQRFANPVGYAEFAVLGGAADGGSVLDGYCLSPSAPVGIAVGYYRMRTQVEAALASLGLAEYKRLHGEYPEGLQDVVPALLPRLPIDYACLRPLRYVRQGKTYLLYSIGANGVDDEGRTTESLGLAAADDIVFSSYQRWIE